MTETLRWILIAFSIVLLVGIYLWGKRGNKGATTEGDSGRARPEPRLAPESSHDDYDDPSFAEARGRLRDEVEFEAHSAYDDVTDHAEVARGSRSRIEPTFTDDVVTTAEDGPNVVSAEVRVAAEAAETELESTTPTSPAPSEHAPTLGMSATPQPKRIERRKIIALRLAAGPERISGAQLRAAFEAASLEHGKYDVFHRLHDGVAIFSVASMVEPGTFDLERMDETVYPGVTLFAQLPGPVSGSHALNELVACARSLHQSLGGTLQDERGVPLTVHRVERLKQEVRDFERTLGSVSDSGVE